MRRILCLWLPQWPLQRLKQARSELAGQPILLYEPHPRGGLQVAACSLAGIRPGLPLAEATALVELDGHTHVPLHLEAHDPEADRLALGRLADACQRYSPLVGVEDSLRPDSLLLEIGGVARLQGGEEALAEQVLREFKEAGLEARVAVADTPGAAWAVARFAGGSSTGTEPHRALRIVPPGATLEALARLPAAALRLPDETLSLLAELGLRRIGQVAALRRQTLSSRFGPRLLQRLDQALGLAPEVITAHPLPAEFQARRVLESAVESREVIEAVLEELLGELSGALRRRNEGALRLGCRLDSPSGEPVEWTIGLFRPSSSARYLQDLLRLKLESLRLREGISGVELQVMAAAPLELEQQELFASPRRRHGPRHLAALVDRLSSRLGREAVLRPRLVPDAQPEYACAYFPLAGQELAPLAPSSGKKRPTSVSLALPPGRSFAAERPLRLYAPPVPLEVMSVVPEGPPLQFRFAGQEQVVVRGWGPERIETGWWRTRCVRRDYYRVETACGGRFWLFRELNSGRWFLHGEFD